MVSVDRQKIATATSALGHFHLYAAVCSLGAGRFNGKIPHQRLFFECYLVKDKIPREGHLLNIPGSSLPGDLRRVFIKENHH